jgi:two-component sensor histidine kinase
MFETETRLTHALRQQETFAAEMTHRIKNLFALAASMVRLSLRGSATKEELAEKAAGRLQALSDASAIVRRDFGQIPWERAELAEILARILRPHDEGRSTVAGPAFSVGERATSNLVWSFASWQPTPRNTAR